MDQRLEFVTLARGRHTPLAELCRRFDISRKTGYKWLARAQQTPDGDDRAWARDRPTTPRHSPARCSPAVEALVVNVRREHPAWGARKIKRRLEDLGHRDVPSPSTVTAILRRHGLIAPEASRQRQPWRRFEYEEPNLLWQMDFKGPVALRRGQAHPLTVIDDHSRFAVCIKALANEQTAGVKAALVASFRRYGLPHRLLSDNGSCWGASCSSRYTQLGAWLMRLGVGLIHGRPYHPQTQGKDERFNRTLKAEGLAGRTFVDLADCQEACDAMRRIYNEQRPHEGIGMATPMTRYRISPVGYPETLPPIEYLDDDIVRVVSRSGVVSLAGSFYMVGRSFVGEPVALRATTHDGRYDVYYCSQRIGRLDVRRPMYIKSRGKSAVSRGASPPRDGAGHPEAKV